MVLALKVPEVLVNLMTGGGGGVGVGCSASQDSSTGIESNMGGAGAGVGGRAAGTITFPGSALDCPLLAALAKIVS
jgi:hypothetical protein